MKKLWLVAWVVLLMTEGLFSIDRDKFINTVINGYILALNTDNQGLQDDALMRIAELRSRFHDADLNKVTKTLKKVMQKHKCPCVRTHAVLVLAYITEPQIFKNLACRFDQDVLSFYNQINSELYRLFQENQKTRDGEEIVAINFVF